MWELVDSEIGRHRATPLGSGLRQGAAKAITLAIFSAVAVFGQVVPGRYIVELSGDPAAAAPTRAGARLAARDTGFTARRAAVRRGQVPIRRGVADHGGTVLESMDTVVNGLIVNIPDDRAAELLQVPGVSKVHPVRELRMTLDHALPLHQVPAAWATLPLGQDSAGAGIKIGIIDTGIDVNHPAFRDPLPAVEGFPKVLASTDTKFTNAKIIVARNYSKLLGSGGDPDADDRVGHGTGTSMAAAGGAAVSPYGPIIGVAPKAYLGNYKVFAASGSTTTDIITKAVDDAVADGMDVINLSLGSYVTDYSDVDVNTIEIATLEAAVRAGVVVTVSAGNDGPGAGTIGDLASAPDVISAGAIRNDRTLGFALRVGGVDLYAAVPGSGPNPGKPISGTLLDVAGLDPSGQACSALSAGSAVGNVVLIQRGNCPFEDKVNNVAAGGAVGVIVYNNVPGTQPMNVGAATLPAVSISQADGLDLKSRLAADSTLQASLEFGGLTAFPVRPDLSTFSSRGPNVGSALKPDLVAVGEALVTGAQSTYPNGELYDPTGYVDIAGTSYSAPLTAGAAAILKGARPGLTADQYRSLLINNAGAASTGAGKTATIQQAGAGVLNVAAALSGTVAANPTSLNFGTGQGSLKRTLTLKLTNLGASADTYSLAVVPVGDGPAPALSMGTLQLDPNGSQQLPVSLDAMGLAAGEYQGFIQVTGTANPNTVRIPYWFAVPGSAPAAISILYSDSSARAVSTDVRAVVFRVVDVAGLPFSGSETPNAVVSGTGGGTVRRTYRFGTVPGTYAVDVVTGTGSLQLSITVGDVTQSVVIPVG